MSVSRLCRAYWSNACAFIPVIVFLAYGRWGGPEGRAHWETAYLIAGLLGLGHLFWLRKHRPGHWIALGVDLYLLIGALLALLSPLTLQLWGQRLGVAPVLACVLLIGLYATWRAGQNNPLADAPLHLATQTHGPLLHRLLIATLLALLVALLFRHSVLLGGVVPILALVLLRSHLLKRQGMTS